MAGLADFRKQHPEYNDMPDGALADALHAKFYADIPKQDFDRQMGIAAAPPAPPEVSTKEDVLRSGNAGFAKGLAGTAGLPTDLVRLGMKALGIPTREGPLPANVTAAVPGGGAYGGYQELSDLTKPEGGYYEPKTTAGRFAEKAGAFAPAAIGGTASLPARIVGRVLAPAAGAQFAGSMVDEKEHPVLHGLAEGGGALLGALGAGGVRTGVPALKNKLADLLLGKAGGANPEAAALAEKAKGLGIDIRPGQLSPNRFINTADDQLSRLPFTGYGEGGSRISTEAQNTQFTKALGRQLGLDADALTPDIMSKAKADIWAKFTKGLANTTIRATPETDTAIEGIRKSITDIAPALTTEDARRLNGTLSKIYGNIEGGLTGPQYQTMRQNGGIIDALSNDTNPTVAGLGRKMREALDDLFQAQAPAEDAALIKDARSLYRKYKVIEPLADKAPLGNVSPPLLLGQVNKAYPDLARAGEIGDLGRIGQTFLKTPPNSGTAERSWITKLATGAGIGSAATMAPLTTAASLGLGLASARGVGKAINSDAHLARMLAKPGATVVPTNRIGSLSKLLSIK